MALRKVVKILLYCGAGILGIVVLLMLAIKLALDRAPAISSRDQGLGSRPDRLPHRRLRHVSPAFRWYGPELYFDQLEFGAPRTARECWPARRATYRGDLWQLLQSGKLFAGRIELDSPNISITRLGPGTFSLASEIDLGAAMLSHQTLTLDDFRQDPSSSPRPRRRPGRTRLCRTWNCGTSNWICTAATGLRRCSLREFAARAGRRRQCDRHGRGSAPSIRWSGP